MKKIISLLCLFINLVYSYTGLGTELLPFIIETKEDLLELSFDTVNWDKYFLQTTDIVFLDSLTEDWNNDGVSDGTGTTGFSAIQFRGHYDGGGFAIKNLYIQKELGQAGLFSFATNAVVKNVFLSNVHIYNQYYFAGAIMGHSRGSSIINCHATGKIHSRGASGGLTGYADTYVYGANDQDSIYSSIEGSSFNGVVTALESKAGGLIGGMIEGVVSNSMASAFVQAEYWAGGLIGQVSVKTNVNNSYAAGVVQSSQSGGLVGGAFYSSIKDCYATGTVLQGDSNTGFIGRHIDPEYSGNFYDQTTTNQIVGGPGLTNPVGISGLSHSEFLTTDFSIHWNYLSEIAQNIDHNADGIVDEKDYPWKGNSGSRPLLYWQKVALSNTVEYVEGTQRFNYSMEVEAYDGVLLQEIGIRYRLVDTKNWVFHNVPISGNSYSGSIDNLTIGKYIVQSYARDDAGTLYLGDMLHSVVWPTGGLGTLNDPFLVSTLEDLNAISAYQSFRVDIFNQINDIHAASTQNWNLGDHDNNSATVDQFQGFQPIGDVDSAFAGSYDGQGYTIDSLYVNRPGYDHIGFFGNTVSGLLANIQLSNVKIYGKDTVGALVGGFAKDSIFNVSVSGVVVGENVTGGVAGSTSQGVTVRNIRSTCDVYGNDYVGGIFGRNDVTTVYRYSASGKVMSRRMGGGVVGHMDYAKLMDGMFNGASIGEEYSGAIVGYMRGGLAQSFFSGYSIETSNATHKIIGYNQWGSDISTVYSDSSLLKLDSAHNLQHVDTPFFTSGSMDLPDTVWNVESGFRPYLKNRSIAIMNSGVMAGGSDGTIEITHLNIASDQIVSKGIRYQQFNDTAWVYEVNTTTDTSFVQDLPSFVDDKNLVQSYLLTIDGMVLGDMIFVSNKSYQHIILDQLPSERYGSADIPINVSVASQLPIDLYSSDTSIVSISSHMATIKKPGLVRITAIQVGNAGYYADTVSVDWTIYPGYLHIGIDSALSKYVGEIDPVFNYSTTGLKAGDTLTGGLEREQGETVGTYKITSGTLSHPNYLVLVAGHVGFTILPTLSSSSMSSSSMSSSNTVLSSSDLVVSSVGQSQENISSSSSSSSSSSFNFSPSSSIASSFVSSSETPKIESSSAYTETNTALSSDVTTLALSSSLYTVELSSQVFNVAKDFSSSSNGDGVSYNGGGPLSPIGIESKVLNRPKYLIWGRNKSLPSYTGARSIEVYSLQGELLGKEKNRSNLLDKNYLLNNRVVVLKLIY